MMHARMGRWVTAGWVLLGVAGGVGVGCGSNDSAQKEPPGGEQAQIPVGAEDQERIDIGLRISPVPLKLEGLDRNLVGLGSYILNAQTGCSDCHTQPGYLPEATRIRANPSRSTPRTSSREESRSVQASSPPTSPQMRRVSQAA